MSNKPDKFQSRLVSGRHAKCNSRRAGQEGTPTGTPYGLTGGRLRKATTKPFSTKRTYYVYENKRSQNSGVQLNT